MLKHGDQKAKDKFRVAYLEYTTEYRNKQRNRPEEYKVEPKAVVECIDPDLLFYICTTALKSKYRTNNPARVSICCKGKSNSLALRGAVGQRSLTVRVSDTVVDLGRPAAAEEGHHGGWLPLRCYY